MSDNVRTSAEIEAEIEEERSALARSIEALQDRLSPEHLVSTAADTIRDSGADIVKSVTKAARDNPMAVAIVGAGLTMLAAGIGTKKVLDRRAESGSDQPRIGYATSSSTSAGGFRESDDGRSFEERVEAAEQATRHRDYSVRRAAPENSVWDKWRSRAKYAYGRLGDMPSAAQLRERFSEGTETMSEAARERVLRARSKVISAQEKLEAQAKKGGDDMMRFAKDDPLLAGALVFAAGAALGALLPRSSVEDDYLGEHRDRVLDRADQIFREETAKLKAVAAAAASEGRAAAEEKLQSVYDTAEDVIDETRADAEEVLDKAVDSYDRAKTKVEDTIAKAKEETPTGKDAVKAVESEVLETANRMADAAKDEAKKQKLGGSI